MPYSLVWFAITAVIYLLQVFPVTGIFMMFLMAPFWSVLTVNAGMVALAVEALVKPRFRVWLLLPVLYFGGYAAYAWKSHHDFMRLEAEVLKVNRAAGGAAFDPDRHHLVVESGPGAVLAAAANRFVQGYGLKVAYHVNTNYKTAGHTAYRVARQPVCKAVRADKRFQAAFVQASGMTAAKARSREFCALSGPEDPTRPIFHVTGQQRREAYGAVTARVYDLSIRMPDGRAITLMTASAAILPWLPMPVAGCWLNSGAPSWDCSVSFMPGKMRGAGGAGSYGTAIVPVLAAALGLKELTREQWKMQAVSEPPVSFLDVAQERRVLSLDNLDRIIADPTVRLTVHDIRGLREDVGLWRDKVPGMVDALGRAFDAGRSARERAWILQDLLNRLPDHAWQPVGARMLDMVAARAELSQRFLREETVERFGDLGAQAVVVLERYLNKRSRGGSKGVVLGLCRAGAAAAHLADDIALPLINVEMLSRDRAIPAIVALLRMDRSDLAGEIVAGDRYGQAVAEFVRAKVTSASPRDACMGYAGWNDRRRGR